MRKFLPLVAVVALVAVACFGGGPPPPPPTDPHDVLVVGDSVAFSFGCVLGDGIPGVPAGSCQNNGGFTAKNASVGACTIYERTVVLYNGGSAGVPNCDTVAVSPENRTWAQLADYYVPKVVVINTAGWEVVDRWVNLTSVPDSQWGATGCSPTNTPSPQCDAYKIAATYYSSALFDAISMFRSKGAVVLVTNAPYFAPPQPEPPIDQVPAGLGCSWWEPYPATAPQSAGPDCTGNATQGSGGSWRPPANGLTYRSSRTKIDQFNEIVNLVKNNNFGGDPGVRIFNFKSHFNDGPINQYSDYVCPPPNDTTIAAQLAPDSHTPDLTDMAWQCATDIDPANWDYAILARAPDKGHLSVAGQYQVLQPYIEPCVKAFIPGASGGDANKCN